MEIKVRGENPAIPMLMDHDQHIMMRLVAAFLFWKGG
jgi:hypothetical protein